VIHVSASIGIAHGHADCSLPDDILRNADAALYHAKAHGGSRIQLFDDKMRVQVMQRLRLGNDIRQAIAEHQMRVLYQPIVRLESGRVEGFEALLRWEHPEFGAVSPAQFIPIAEEIGLISELGYWVLRESCRQLRIWRDEFPQCPWLSMSVNISARQLADPTFVDQVQQVLRDIGIEGEHLNLELTESAMVEYGHRIDGVIERLRACKVRLHLDDFGTGYSSLAHLHHMPFDAVKIDRSFIADMQVDGRTANIVQAVQTMASNRSMIVIAEGIEKLEQLVQLQALDCDSGQGFYLCKPVDARTAAALLQSGGKQAMSA
jgi:EAL domain-containing protein (putative c-di-GMP-specific phosphodiesterase class I)